MSKDEKMSLEEFAEEFEKIKNKGWIKNKFPKNKNGGAGNTLEYLLGIKENNLKIPDLGEIELKTTKKQKSGAITLFTYDSDIWKIKQREALKKYGKWNNEEKRYDLYFIHEIKKPTSNDLFTKINGENLEISDKEGEVIISYPFEKMAFRWNQKLKQSIIVNFEERKDPKGISEYKYGKFKHHIGTMSAKIMKKAWEEELLILETALHSKPNGTARNHGTRIRAKQKDIETIYQKTKNQNKT